jgi:aminoglycoside 6-adenylyltransferase
MHYPVDGEAYMLSVLNGFQSDQVIAKLREWATERASIRAMLLTSTRADPHAIVDALSDYDIVLVVDDIRPYYQDRNWLEDFGEVLVTYWDPIYQSPKTGIEVFGNVVQYVEGLRIDSTLWPIGQVQQVATGKDLPADLDVGYTVLLDKEGITDHLTPPTHTAYIPEPPTKVMFDKVVEDFYSDAPYVAKCLLRDELMPAKWCLEHDMKHPFLRQMLEWRMELDYAWSLPVGALGKGLKKRLPAAIWTALEGTCAGAGLEENWEALFKTLNLFREVGEQVASGLGLEFPNELDRRVMIFLREYRTKGAVLFGR